MSGNPRWIYVSRSFDQLCAIVGMPKPLPISPAENSSTQPAPADRVNSSARSPRYPVSRVGKRVRVCGVRSAVASRYTATDSAREGVSSPTLSR